MKRGTGMLAKEKWQIKTIAVLERVFEERKSQMEKHGAAMASLPDGTGPGVSWLPNTDTTAAETQEEFREDYEIVSEAGALTRMHLVREELAEAFELDGDSPEFVDEILQVAALCVQWAEYKTPDETTYRGYTLRSYPSREIVEVLSDGVVIDEAHFLDSARATIDDWLNAP